MGNPVCLQDVDTPAVDQAPSLDFRDAHTPISFRIPGGPSLDRTAHRKGGWAVPFCGVSQHSSPGLGLAPISGLVGKSYLC